MDDYIECPNCGSTEKDFCDDNLDDLFDYGFGSPFEYIRSWECGNCGTYFESVIKFTFEDMGTRLAE